MKFSDEERSNPNHKRRELDEQHYQRIGLPRELWSVQLHGVQPENQSAVVAYIYNLVPLLIRGYGMWLTGSPGVGKSAIAAILAKAAAAHVFTSYFTTLSDLRDRTINKTEYMEGVTYGERARTCDFLVIDDLQGRDADSKFLGRLEVTDLIRGRCGGQKSTVVTSALSRQQITDLFGGLLSRTEYRMPVFNVKGKDLCAERIEEAQAIFLKD